MMAPGAVRGGMSSEAIAESYKERFAKSKSQGTLGGSTASGGGGGGGAPPGRRSKARLSQPGRRQPTDEPSKLVSLLGRSGASSWAAPATAPEAEWGHGRSSGRLQRGHAGTEGATESEAPSVLDGVASDLNTRGSFNDGGTMASGEDGCEGSDDDDDATASPVHPLTKGFPRSHPSGLPRPEAGPSGAAGGRRGSGFTGVVVRRSETAWAPGSFLESRQSAARVIADAGGLEALSRRWRAGEWPQGAVFGEGDRGDSGRGGGDAAPARRDDGDGSDNEDGSRRGRVVFRRRGSEEEYDD